MASARTYYQTLGVAPDAESVVIEAAYRALMKKYHPDQGGAPAPAGGPSAADINQAYAVLREASRRADYDQKEWIRQQNVQLASYVPPPAPRRTNFFGWGGWLVAMVLAGMIALMASKGKVGPLDTAEAARAALLAEPDLRTQPFKPGEALSEAELAEIRAEAYAPQRPAAAPPKVEAAPQAEPLSTIPAPALAPDNAASPAVRAPARRPAWTRGTAKPARRRPPAARTAREKDFLERQGYIY
ncbi:MAG: DnaJ domain-containing protein [Alphaproteobacteria bacterium]|nr:DnaJ domain-containing protein [Alphaproteobacteria bacterium]MBV9373040.1 DnaJ domain-containing protein [Alphaproteobacteria bacterium]MBV9902923.1 DnaJ domain-containing protein [Alphaproteobacteria bacterium]